MKLPIRAATALIGLSLACSAWAAWPEKTVRLIVPAPAGGTMDIAARIIGQQLTTDTGKTVVVENKPGAGASIGIQAMLQAPADGYTLAMVAANVMAEIPHVIKMPFDPLKDIIPVASVARSGTVLITSTKVPAKDFKSLLAYLKTRKGGSFASYSPGTVSHYAGLILSDKAGLDMQHIGYAGSAPALQALLGDQVDFMFDGMLSSTPFIKSGKVRPYAFTGKTRSRHMPDVPTVTELGYSELTFVGWVGPIASAKVPADVLAEIHTALAKAAKSPTVIQKLSDLGMEPEAIVDTPALLRETREMSERNGAIVKKYGIKLN